MNHASRNYQRLLPKNMKICFKYFAHKKIFKTLELLLSEKYVETC